MLIQDEFGKSGNYFDCAHFLTFVPLLDFWHFVIAVIFDHYLEWKGDHRFGYSISELASPVTGSRVQKDRHSSTESRTSTRSVGILIKLMF